MKILALDLSKSCTGWAVWHEGWDTARLGHWRLGGEWSTNGDVFNALHRRLSELKAAIGFGRLYIEQKVNPQNLQIISNYQTIALMGGLEAYAEGFAAAYRMPYRAINVSSWRGDFIGKDVDGTIKAAVRRRNKMAKEHGGKRESASDKLKLATMERCRQLGFSPRKQDEADALGILDYQMQLLKITPPWRQNEVLQPMSGAAV